MPIPPPKPIPSELINSLRYEDGCLYWRCSRQGVAAGTPSTVVNGNGYKIIRWKRKTYLQARVIWAMHYGDTDLVIDHINMDKTDNRIENLRAITEYANKFNSNRGVHPAYGGKWRASWGHDTLIITADKFEAWCVRKSAEAKYISSQSLERR